MSANGIDFVIGGKDRAGPAMAGVARSLQNLERQTNSVSLATRSLSAITAKLTAGYLALKAGMATLGGLNAINEAYVQQAEAVKKLEIVLGLQGAEVEKESKRLQAFAAEMQALTGVGDEVTLGFMKQAAQLGVSADKLDDMASAAIGLSEATGKELNTSLRYLLQAQEGNFEAIQRSIPALRNMATEEERLAAVTKIAKDGLETKAKSSHTVAGMASRASGAIGDLMEVIGEIIAPIRILISQGLKVLAEVMTKILAPAAEYARKTLENIGPVMDWLAKTIVTAANILIGAFTMIEVAAGNLGTVWQLIASQAELSMRQLIGSVQHALLEALPAYAAWFADNFWTIMWDGFEAAEPLPDMMIRQITEREQELAERVGKLGEDLGANFSEKFQKRMIELDLPALQAGFNLDLKKPELKMPNSTGSGLSSLQATQGRLLTRGPESRTEKLLEESVRMQRKAAMAAEAAATANQEAAEDLDEVANNTKNTLQLVMIT